MNLNMDNAIGLLQTKLYKTMVNIYVIDYKGLINKKFYKEMDILPIYVKYPYIRMYL